ncbi:hypothetical protein GJ496_001728 [Pomphorhynchus laevis]|nr:hypothetical protein GJ496_001728 [Pomphorhynchus laevis]
MTNSEYVKLYVQQLQQELKTKRELTSVTISDLVRYCADNESDDRLLQGFPRKDQNPWKDRSVCTIL